MFHVNYTTLLTTSETNFRRCLVFIFCKISLSAFVQQASFFCVLPRTMLMLHPVCLLPPKASQWKCLGIPEVGYSVAWLSHPVTAIHEDHSVCLAFGFGYRHCAINKSLYNLYYDCYYSTASVGIVTLLK